MGDLAAELKALAYVPERVACHACRLLAAWEGAERAGLVAALGSRAAAKRVTDVVRAHGEILPEQHVRDHRNGQHP